MANLVLIAQAAQEVTYSVKHISLLLRQGKIKGQKIGGTWLVDLEDLKRYEQEMNQLGTKKFDPSQKQ
jgi:hypothetical protein